MKATNTKPIGVIAQKMTNSAGFIFRSARARSVAKPGGQVLALDDARDAGDDGGLGLSVLRIGVGSRPEA